MEKKLTPKQSRFIKEYIKSGNGTQSAIKAGYSEKTAQEIASENLLKPIIKAKIEKVMSKEAEEIGLNARKILTVLNNILDKDDDKLLSHILKAAELSGKHLKMWNDDKVDLTVQHKAAITALEELE